MKLLIASLIFGTQLQVYHSEDAARSRTDVCTSSLKFLMNHIPEGHLNDETRKQRRRDFVHILERLPFVNFFTDLISPDQNRRQDLFVVESLEQIPGYFSDYWRMFKSVYEKYPEYRQQILRTYIKFSVTAEESLRELYHKYRGLTDALELRGQLLSGKQLYNLVFFAHWISRQNAPTSAHRPIYIDNSVIGESRLNQSRSRQIWATRRSLAKAFHLPEDFKLSILPGASIEIGGAFQILQELIQPIQVASKFRSSLSSDEKTQLRGMAKFLEYLGIGKGHRMDSPNDNWQLAEAFFNGGGIFVFNDFNIYEPLFSLFRRNQAVRSQDERFSLEVEGVESVWLGEPFFSHSPVFRLRLDDHQTQESFFLDAASIRDTFQDLNSD